MGTSRSWGELAGKLEQSARNVQASTPKTVRIAAERALVVMEAEIRSRVPDGDMSGLSHGRKKSGKVGVRIARTSQNTPSTPAASIRAVGPVHWLESGTRPHISGAGRLKGNEVVLTKRGKYRKGQRKLMLVGGQFPRFGPIRTPGMRAGHTWSKAIRRALPVASQAFEQRSVADMLAPFK